MRCVVFCGDGDMDTYILLNAINQNYSPSKRMDLSVVNEDRWELIDFAAKNVQQGIVYFLPICREEDQREWRDIAREIWRIDASAYTIFVCAQGVDNIELVGTHVYDCLRSPLRMIKMKDLLGELRWDMERRQKTKKLLVKSQSKMVLVAQNDILFCSRDRDHVIAHTRNGDMRWRESFSSLLDRMAGNQFVRIHSGYIVNKSSIHSLDLNQKTILLHNGAELPYSRRNEKRIIELMTTISSV